MPHTPFQKMLISEFSGKLCPICPKYSHAGKTFCFHNDNFDGLYWCYETEHFIIDIHDFFIKKEQIFQAPFDMKPYFSFISSYIKSANGECFNFYQPFTSNTVLVMKAEQTNLRFLLHANSPYISVSIKFKDSMLKEYVTCNLSDTCSDFAEIFFETQNIITSSLGKLADEILACQMKSPAAEIFFEAKAKEWLSITLDAYFNKVNHKPISKSDEVAIETVANYISDHYALDISQELLEKIAMMSGTKLKTVFKQKYHMSITEFSQRKRINIAETLLSTTELEIKDIARAVGYSSHSRFTTLFKKYKGIYPREIKKLKVLNTAAENCNDDLSHCSVIQKLKKAHH